MPARPKVMTRTTRLCLPILLLASWMGGSTLPGLASCAGAPASIGESIGAAQVVFVGTVTGTSDGSRTAAVHVDELWRGPVLPAEVTLHGSPDVSAAATSVDRHYESGKRYLFVPNEGGGSEFTDNSCSPTREFSSDLQALRPASVRRYPAAPPGPPLLPLGMGAILLVAGAIVAVAIRRKAAGGSGPEVGV